MFQYMYIETYLSQLVNKLLHAIAVNGSICTHMII